MLFLLIFRNITWFFSMTYNPPTLSPSYMALAIDHIIQARKTVKALGDIHNPSKIPENFLQRVNDAMCIAGWAPFHYPVHESHCKRSMNSPVPWRFYSLNQASCLKLADCIIQSSANKVNEKHNIIRMMGACGAMVLVTWLPEPKNSQRAKNEEARVMINEEHLAAASAATQNLLLSAKAREIDSYWSSGGILNDSECFKLCGIPAQEKLLGAIFMLPELTQDIDVRAGKMRNKRGNNKQWMKWISIEHGNSL
jgi:nitroreductase